MATRKTGDGKDNLKKKIAMLWILMAVAMSAHSILLFMEMIEKIELPLEPPREVYLVVIPEWVMAMDPAQMLFIMSLYWLIPLWMAFLSVTLKDVANRRVNLVLGVIFTIVNILHIFGCPVAHASAHQILIVLSTIVVSLLIVGYAWKWPKEEP